MERLKQFGLLMQRAALSVLNARYSISSWLWAIVSILTSIILIPLILSESTPGLAEFDAALPINLFVWVFGLLLSELVTISGMAFRSRRTVRVGAIPAFLLWTAGGIGFLLIGNFTTLAVLVVPLIIFHAHLCIASLLRDRPQV